MKQFFFTITIFLVGILIGGSWIWIASYSKVQDDKNDRILLVELLRYSNTKIDAQNFICEGETGKNVASVIGSILESNLKNVRNRISFNCSNNACALIIDNCMPWQSDSCGGRILTFELDKENHIIPTSFKCIDAP